jgi:predicted nucleotidyltransferase
LSPSIVDIEKAVQVLAAGGVEFIVIGGVAAALHGSGRATFDLDVVYSRTRENIRRLASALQPYSPYLRGAPPGLPFRWDEPTIEHGLNFTLSTSFGPLDLLGEVVGGGAYHDLLPHADEVQAFGASVRRVRLEKLIQLKRAAGRPKDLEAIAELQALLDDRDSS